VCDSNRWILNLRLGFKITEIESQSQDCRSTARVLPIRRGSVVRSGPSVYDPTTQALHLSPPILSLSPRRLTGDRTQGTASPLVVNQPCRFPSATVIPKIGPRHSTRASRQTMGGGVLTRFEVCHNTTMPTLGTATARTTPGDQLPVPGPSDSLVRSAP
jgi:hypothetical protein